MTTTPDKLPATAEPVAEAQPKQRRKWLTPRVRVAIPFVIVVVAGIALGSLWQYRAGDATLQVFAAAEIVPLTVMLLLVWWVFLSPVRWKTRFAGLGVLAALIAAFFSFYRFKEFSGSMVPIFESRSLATAEQRSAEYWKNAGKDAAPVEKSASGGKLGALVIGAGDWAQFGGPERDGIARDVRVRTDWDREPPKRLWRHPVGSAWSSFAIVGPYAFTQEQRGSDETVVCYDALNGKQIWAHTEPNVRFEQTMGGLGPRATPTVFDNRLYTVGATGILNCLDPRTGSVIWSTNTYQDASTDTIKIDPLNFGLSCSPLVYDDLVVVNPGGPRKSMDATQTTGRALIAYNRVTGKQVWNGGDYMAGYASPILATIAGVRQVVIFDAVGAGGYDAKTGKELWRSEQWMNDTFNNIAQPIVLKDGSIFLSSGYGRGSILFDVKKSGGEWTTSRKWAAPNKFKLKFNPGVTRDGYVYGLDEGILSCLDLSNGKILWKKGRYQYGQILLLQNALFVISEEGDAVLVDVSPGGAREIARFHALDGKTWNTPALADGRIYLRNAEEAACYDLGPIQTAELTPRGK